MLGAEDLDMAGVELPVEIQSITETTQDAIGSADQVARAQRLFVVVAIDPAQRAVALHALVPGLGVATERPQDGRLMPDQDEGSLVVGTERLLPVTQGGLRERLARVVTALDIQIAGQVQDHLADFPVVTLHRSARLYVRPQVTVAFPVVRHVWVAGIGGGDEHVRLVAYLVAFVLVGKLLAQNQLREAMQLEPVAAVVDLGQRILLDLADHTVAFPVAAERGAQTGRKHLYEPADGQNIPGNRFGREVGTQIEQQDNLGLRFRSLAKAKPPVTPTRSR